MIERGNCMRGVLIILWQLMLIAIAVILADIFQSSVDFIPKAIISLPEVDYTVNDFRVVLSYFMFTHALVLATSQIIYGRWMPDSPGRTANELYSLAAAFSLSALLIFTTTSVAFDPNFIVGIAIFSALLFLSTGLIYTAYRRAGAVAYSAALIRSILRKAFTLPGIIIIVFALSPGILAKLFVSNRDVANVITQVRIYFAGSGDTSYEFVNALQGRTFSQPILIKESPFEPARIYILEREGRLVSVNYPTGDNYKIELDINNKVGPAEVENGALGFTFPPGNAPLRHVYLYYTQVSTDGQVNRLSRFDLDAETLEAVSDSELPLISLAREDSGFHNGGSVEFGPDGYLYLALGEGVHPKGVSSQRETLRGGILRIDVNCSGADTSLPIQKQPAGGKTANYCIPHDNPFIDSEAVMPEYWALGLRNPYRVSFDTLTGKLWAGDVGSTKWEEINIIEKGGNYQYPWVEGDEATGLPKPTPVIGKILGPVYTYVHTAYDRAVIGGSVYRGSKFPELTGRYLFADNYSSKFFSMTLDSAKPEVEHIATADQFAQRGTSSITILSNDDILLTTLGRSAVPSGEVLRLQSGDDTPEHEADLEDQNKNGSSYSKKEIYGIYVANCARCHGVEGSGNGPDALALKVDLPNLASEDFQASRTDDQLAVVIRDGGYATGMSPLMPPWGHILNEEEIAGLIDWIRAL
jgi:glucose/arabinose dehydrogenase